MHGVLITALLSYLFSQITSTKRPGFWKFNSPLLEDESYITELKENIKIYRNKYHCVEDKGLRWDLMKMEVRGFTIAFTKRKAKNKRDEEKKLQAQSNELLSQSEKCKNNPQLRIHIQTI